MARPRSFSTEDAVAAATSVFWSKGYQDTAISDLEQATGLNRSSLYAAFGTKQAIFELALKWYLRGFIGPRLAPLERPGAGADDIEGFFTGLAGFFRTGSQARQGCPMINSIAEHEGAAPAWAAGLRLSGTASTRPSLTPWQASTSLAWPANRRSFLPPPRSASGSPPASTPPAPPRPAT